MVVFWAPFLMEHFGRRLLSNIRPCLPLILFREICFHLEAA